MNIAVVGLGIIGGSFCKAIKKYTDHRVIGINRTKSTAEKALKEGAIDEIGTHESLENADLIILSMYPQAVVDYVARYGEYIKKGAVVTDVSGIKRAICPQMTELSEKPFRAKQLYDWMHVKLAGDYDEMTNLSAAFRNRLKEEYPLTTLRVVREQTSAIDGTKKFLFALPDGNLVESVWMQYKHGNSVCISSQVGCRMGCRFCASTLDGLERGLTPAEMLDQIYRIQKLTGERVSNVVVMGSGEPLDNYDNLLVFLRMLTDENGLNISQRNVTVSTCGIVPKMYELAEEKLQITLALSLHATTDEKRRRLMPIANKYGMKELMDACRNYADKTGRRLTFEYSLVGGVNDTKEDAEELIGLAAPLGSHVNLIPVNPIKERDFVQSNHAAIAAFQKRLEKGGVNVTIRREMGRDIDGACGQLRRRHMEEQSE